MSHPASPGLWSHPCCSVLCPLPLFLLMGAHRRRFIRQRNTANRRRGTKAPDVASLDSGDGSCSVGSWESAADAYEARTASPSPRSDLAPGTLIRRPTVSSSVGDKEGCDTVEASANGAEEKPELPSYHPDAGCTEMTGYAGKLSSSHEAALGGLRQWLTRDSVDLAPLLGDGTACMAEEEDLALLRFLRHNSWDVELTRAQLEASLSWRVETSVAGARGREPWEVSKCASAGTFEQLCMMHYPHYTLGTDRVGRPILVQKYGNFDISKLQEYTTLQGLLLYHAWEQEKNAELLRRASARTGYLVETYAMIMDFGGMSMGLVNRDFLWLLREISEIDRQHYPGRGGDIYVINTPPLFGLVWQGIRGLLATQASVHVFGREKDWKAALAEAIDPAVLPLEYGGTAPPLAHTPLLPAVHGALRRDDAAVLPAAMEGEGWGRETDDAAVPAAREEDASASSMSSILRCFSSAAGVHRSSGGGGGAASSRMVEGDSDGGGGGGGGVSPVVTGRSLDGSGDSFAGGGVDGRGDGGGGRLSSFINPGKERGSAERGGGGSIDPCKPVPEEMGGHTLTDGSKPCVSKTPITRRVSSHGPPSSGTPISDKCRDAEPVRGVSPPAPIAEAAAGAVALPASDDPCTAVSSLPPSSSFSSSSHVVIIRHQVNEHEGSTDFKGDGTGQECEHGSDDDLAGWVLDAVPGARMAAAVMGTLAGATLGATLGAVGFAAGIAEAVLPNGVWAEGVQAFQRAQFLGGWALGH